GVHDRHPLSRDSLFPSSSGNHDAGRVSRAPFLRVALTPLLSGLGLVCTGNFSEVVMFSPARVGKAGYVLGLFTVILALLGPSPSSGQFRIGMPAPGQQAPRNFLPMQGMGLGGMGGLGGGMMGMGGGMNMGGGGMNMGGMMGAGGVNPLQLQLLAEFGAL